MLLDISERPVSSISGSSRFDVVQALNSLDLTIVQFLATGWWFNQEQQRVTPNGSGQYIVPPDATSVDVVSGGPTQGDDGAPVLVVRGGFLYDTQNSTDVFNSTDPYVLLSLHRLIDFADMPHSAREYTYAAATVINQERVLGSKNVDAKLVRRANAAFAIVHKEHLKFKKSNQQFSPEFFDMMHNR